MTCCICGNMPAKNTAIIISDLTTLSHGIRQRALTRHFKGKACALCREGLRTAAQFRHTFATWFLARYASKFEEKFLNKRSDSVRVRKDKARQEEEKRRQSGSAY